MGWTRSARLRLTAGSLSSITVVGRDWFLNGRQSRGRLKCSVLVRPFWFAPDVQLFDVLSFGCAVFVFTRLVGRAKKRSEKSRYIRVTGNLCLLRLSACRVRWAVCWVRNAWLTKKYQLNSDIFEIWIDFFVSQGLKCLQFAEENQKIDGHTGATCFVDGGQRNRIMHLIFNQIVTNFVFLILAELFWLYQ